MVSVILHLLHIGPVLRYVYLLKFRAREMAGKQPDEDLEDKKIKVLDLFSLHTQYTCV